MDARRSRWVRGGRAVLWMAALSALSACGSGELVLGTKLSGEEALPSNSSFASASAVARLFELQRLEVSGTFGNLSSPLLEVEGSAIHLRHGPRGEVGSAVLPLRVETRDQVSGAFNGHLDLNGEQLSAYMAGDFYLVIFTESHPEGELRGQLGGD